MSAQDEQKTLVPIKKSKKKYSSFIEFLNDHKVGRGNEYTHTSMRRGSYYIHDSERKELNRLYYKHVYEDGNKAFLTEKHLDIAPVLIDLDLKFKADKKTRQYTEKQICDIISAYSTFIKKYVDIETKKQLLAFLFEKTKPVLAKSKNTLIIKDGIHIIFPYLNMPYALQFMMRDYVISQCPEIFKDLSMLNSYSDIVDESVIKRNNWLMYGSRKPDNYGVEHESYKLTNIYDTSGDEFVEVDNTYTTKKLLRILSLQDKHMREKFCEVNADFKGEIIEYEKKNFRKVRKKRKITTTKRKKKSPKKKVKDEELVIYRKMAKLLLKERAEGYRGWYDVGLCLHNIDHRMLQDWIEFSKQSPKFQAGECQIEWECMDVDKLGLSVGSLYMWAKKDNLKGFTDIIREDIKTFIYISLKGLSHHDVAKVIYEKFKHDFVCTSNKSKEWYQFDGTRWKELDNGVALRMKLSKDIVAEYRNFSIYCSEMAKNKPDEEDLWDDRAKACHKAINKLKDVSFKEKIMKECADFFHDAEFINKLDSKQHLIGFENGVYDLNKGEFRAGIPEDYISNTTKIDYVELTEEDDEHLENINIFLEQILPKKNVREYVLKLFASFLSGNTGNETVHFWTGSGGNGKSKIIELFEMAFGDYCCKLPVSIFSHARAASNACNPELVRTKGKRFASLQEPDADSPFKVGMLKELTGGDTIQARGLHKAPIEFKPQFKLIMVCNELPEITMDGGVERRLRVVAFYSRFVHEPNPNNKNEYLIDTQLNEKMAEWPELFMRILLEIYKDYKKNGMKVPKEVKIATDKYKKDCDLVSQFICDMIEEDPKSSLMKTYLSNVFKMWYQQTGGKKLPRPKDLYKAMDKKFGAYKGKWKGIRIKEQEEDTSNNTNDSDSDSDSD